MDSVPGISQNQALEGFDLFYLLPNVLVGSYPAKTRKILHSTRKPILMMLTDYLIENFEKVLIINLVAENEAYTMPANSSHSIQQLHIHWFDYQALPLHELSSLVHDVAKFLGSSTADGKNGVFIHCKHGKGRTGTLACALLMHLYKIDVSTANEIFRSRRVLYEVGVKVHSQLQLLNYWYSLDCCLEELYVEKRIIAGQFKIVCITLNCSSPTSQKLDSKIFEVKLASLGYRGYPSPKFTKLGELTVGKNLVCMYPITEDECFRIERKGKLLVKLFATFSINCIMELLYQELKHANNEVSRDLMLEIPWEQMDGIKGTSFKGRKYFDSIGLHISYNKI